VVVSTGRADLGQLAADWWQYQRLAQGSRSERKALELGQPPAAWSARASVEGAIDSGGIEALQVILALLEAAPDASGVAVAAAGPLEDLVHQHGDALVDELDHLARQRPVFRQAMSGVWLSPGIVDPDTERRLRNWLRPLGGTTNRPSVAHASGESRVGHV
jgi:hypothetical protein